MSEEKQGSGCLLKGCLVGCGVMVVLVIGIVVLLFMFGGKMYSFAATQFSDKIAEAVEEKLPEDYDKQQFRDTFGHGVQALKEGKIDQGEIQMIGEHFQTIFDDDELSTEEVDQVLEMINTAAESADKPL